MLTGALVDLPGPFRYEYQQLVYFLGAQVR